MNKNYKIIQNELNFYFLNNLNHKINIAIYAYTMKNGGRARLTSLLIKYLNKIKIFDLFLFTKKYKENNEYLIPDNIKRIHIKENLLSQIYKNKINK